jgi:phosphoglycerate dehydrogenase-like enzyme
VTTPALLVVSQHADRYGELIGAGEPALPIAATTEPERAASIGGGAQIVLGEPALVARALASLPNVEWVQSTWAGIEPLLAAPLRRDYALTNARGVFGGLMSEYVFTYLLAHERRVFEHRASQQRGVWLHEPAGTLRGRTLGLLGVGSIGSALARTARHFGMRVRGFTRRSEDSADVDAWFHGADKATFAAALDYLVAILPGTPATRHIVDAELLSALPPRAVFLNPGRGSLVDEAALLDALRAGRIAGAVLDVFEREPLPPDHPFWRMPNVLITSHTGALSEPDAIAALFLDNYRRFVRGEPLKYRVDFELGY